MEDDSMKQITEKGYQKRIRAACQSIGTYRTEFDIVIGRLAELYVRRDSTKDDFIKSGGGVIITQVNKSGNSYQTKNPLLQEIDHVDRMILDIERELGLTPSAIKKINVELMRGSREDDDPLAVALRILK